MHAQKESLAGQTLSLDPNSTKTVISVSGLYVLKECIKTTIHVSKIKHTLSSRDEKRQRWLQLSPAKENSLYPVWDRFTSGPIVEPKESIYDVQIRKACQNDIFIQTIQQTLSNSEVSSHTLENWPPRSEIH